MATSDDNRIPEYFVRGIRIGLGSTFQREEERRKFLQVDIATDLLEWSPELEELDKKVKRMIEEGSACALMEAECQKILLEQLVVGERGVDQSVTLSFLAGLYIKLGNDDSAKVLLVKARQLLQNIPGTQPLLPRALEHVGILYEAVDKREEAIPLFVRSLDIQRSAYGEDDPSIMRTMWRAEAYAANDDGSESIALYQQLVFLTETLRGSEDEYSILPLTRLGHAFLKEGRPQEAEHVLQRALRAAEKVYGAKHGKVGVAICELTLSKTRLGQMDDAVALYLQGLEMMRNCSEYRDHDPVVEAARTNLAQLLDYLNRGTEARELYEENLRVMENEAFKNDYRLIPHLNNAATSYARARMFDKCVDLSRRSLLLSRIYFNPRALEVLIPLEMLATACISSVEDWKQSLSPVRLCPSAKVIMAKMTP